MKDKSTDKLLNILNTIESKSELENYIASSNSESKSYQLSDYILNICQSKGYVKSQIIKNSGIYRTYGYEILNGKKIPSRDKIIKISIGNKFTLKQANKCLILAKLSPLYAKDPRDSIFIYALNNNLSIIESNIILSEHEFNLLGYI